MQHTDALSSPTPASSRAVPSRGRDGTQVGPGVDGASGAAAKQPFWDARRKRLYPAIALALALYFLWSGIAGWSARHAFFVNVTQSLPNWAFIIDKVRVPHRGDYVFFDPPHDPLILRHFGAKPSLFGKEVYGMPGDTVTREGRVFYVNGKRVALAKPTSKQGEPLALGPVGVIPRNCFFVGTPHRDGLDSRYAAVGWPCLGRIVGTGTPIL